MSAIAEPKRRSPSGRRRALPRRHVVEYQRARILAAATEVIATCGYEGLTVEALTRRARISRKTFYEAFANCDECFAAVVSQIHAQAYPIVHAAYSAERGWLAATRAALGALLHLIDEEPELARVWFVEALSGPELVRAHRMKAATELARAIDRAQALVGTRKPPTTMTAEAVVGGVTHVICSRLAQASGEPFVGLLGPLMYTIVLPYLGATQARAELRRKPPSPAPARRRMKGTHRAVNLRLTYRTVRALRAVHDAPGASNRMVGVACGIADQGQISKLLTRLERRGLVENRGAGQALGASNEWHMTALGLDLIRQTNAPEVFGG